jgi:hypothetical protein
MLGKYDNFPINIHRIDCFDSPLPTKQLQQKLIQALCGLNSKTFDFEEVAIPTIPKCQVIFEFGIAQDNGFNFIDKEETQKALDSIKSNRLQTIDLFCAIRYYRFDGEKKTPLKFDYYLTRIVFGAGKLEFQVFHQRGPRYISPEDLTDIITVKMNQSSSNKALRKTEPS